jgi:phage FluMu protein Com
MIAFHSPSCPKCRTMTTLARITPGPSGFDIRTFECPECDHVHQTVVELVDPMKSRKTNGWLMGQLQAPT